MEIKTNRQPYPSDASDEEWAFLASYLHLMRSDAPQRKYSPRELLNGMRWIARTGGQWRSMPHDLPPWWAVYQQWRRWLEAGCFEEVLHDVRALVRLGADRARQPSAVVMDGRTLRSSPESGARAGFDGHKKTRGSKVHTTVDTMGSLVELTVTTADTDEREQVGPLLARTQRATGEQVERAYADQGYTGERAREAAEKQDVELVVVKLEGVKEGFVLLPRRWVVERTFGWMARFRRLSRDYERLTSVLRAFHFLAMTSLLLHRLPLEQLSS